MSACTEIAPLVAFRTLGVLEPRENARLEEHLASCSSCLAQSSALEEALDVTKLPEVHAPGGGWKEIEAAIGEPRALPVVSVACTFCKDSFGSSARVFCAACLAPYHADCFREHGKCAVAGCGETRVVSARPLSRSARPLALLAVVVAGGLGGMAAWQLQARAPEPPRVAGKPRLSQKGMPPLVGREYALLDPASPGLDYFEPAHVWNWKLEGKLLVGDNGEEGDDMTSLWFGDATWTDIEVRLRFRIRKGALAIRVHCDDGAFQEPLVMQPTMRDGALVAEWQECRFQLRKNDFTYTTSFNGLTSTPSHLVVEGAPGRLALSIPAGTTIDVEQLSVTLANPDAKEPGPFAPVYVVMGDVHRETLDEYARFATLARAKLVDLVEAGSGKRFPWPKGHEPSTIYVARSERDFHEKTHVPEGVAALYYAGTKFEGYDRVVVTFDDEAAREERLRALAHEATQQATRRAWSGGDGSSAVEARPCWFTDGLAVLMGEGLDISRRGEGILAFEVPRDRLRQVRRQLDATPELELERVLELTVADRFQMFPDYYAFAWSIVHYMAVSGEKLDVQGRAVDLKEAFARFFLDNCARGSFDEFGSGHASRGLARAMGFTDEKDEKAALAALDQGWKRWVRSFELPPVGQVTDGRYSSARLGISFAVPSGFDMAPERKLRPFEAVAFTNGERRLEVVVTGSTGVKDLASAVRVAGSLLQERVEPSGDGVEVVIDGASARIFAVTGGEALVLHDRGRSFVVFGDSSAVAEVSRSLKILQR